MNGKHLLTSDEKFKHWGKGEWVAEPDLVEFMHEGFKCKVQRCVAKEWDGFLFGGHLCGYVCVPKDHPKYGKVYNDFEFDVHGGVTYGELENEEYWIGFDCSHSEDIMPSMEALKKLMPDNFFTKDFEKLKKKYPDNALFNPTYRNIAFVIAECKSLAEQLAKDIYPNLYVT